MSVYPRLPSTPFCICGAALPWNSTPNDRYYCLTKEALIVAHRHADLILGKTKALKAYFPFMEGVLHARPIPLSLVIRGGASCSYTA
jgi:hypothetical protein